METKKTDDPAEGIAYVPMAADNLTDISATGGCLVSNEEFKRLETKQNALEVMMKSIYEQNKLVLANLTNNKPSIEEGSPSPSFAHSHSPLAPTPQLSSAHKKREQDETRKDMHRVFNRYVNSYSGNQSDNPRAHFLDWKEGIKTFYHIFEGNIQEKDNKFIVSLIEKKFFGVANAWYQSSKAEFNTPKDLLYAVEKQFAPRDTLTQFALRIRRYDPSDRTLEEIGSDFKNITMYAPKNIDNATLTLQFWLLIPSYIIPSLTKQELPDGIEWTDLLRMAKRYEIPKNNKRTLSYNAGPEFDDINRRNQSRGRISKPLHPQSKAMPCFRCGKMGHIAKVCSENI